MYPLIGVTKVYNVYVVCDLDVVLLNMTPLNVIPAPVVTITGIMCDHTDQMFSILTLRRVYSGAPSIHACDHQNRHHSHNIITVVKRRPDLNFTHEMQNLSAPT